VIAVEGKSEYESKQHDFIMEDESEVCDRDTGFGQSTSGLGLPESVFDRIPHQASQTKQVPYQKLWPVCKDWKNTMMRPDWLS